MFLNRLNTTNYIQQNIQMIKFFIIHKLIINEQIHRYQNHRIMDKPKPGRKRSHNLRYTDPQPKFFFHHKMFYILQTL